MGDEIHLATDKLMPALVRFAKELEWTLDQPTVTDISRNANMVSAVADFLKEIDAPKEFSDAFATLSTALLDFENGASVPLFQRQNAAGRPGLESPVWRDRAEACVVQQFFVAAGMTRKEAAEMIGRRIRPSLAPTIAEKIIGWDDQLKVGAVKNLQAIGIYEGGQRVIASFAGAPPSKWQASAEAVFDDCRDRLKKLF